MRLVDEVHKAVAQILKPGDVAIDATVGNGFDTEFLAQQVGEDGCVYGFDIQAAAIETTRQRLQQQGMSQVQLLSQGHETMHQAIPQSQHDKIKAVLFNLGYLPGTDKAIITQIDTTLLALQQASELLADGGVISVLSYTGHTLGYDEFVAVASWFDKLNELQWYKQFINRERAHEGVPVWFLVQKR